MTNVLPSSDLDLVDAYWRAANYLTIGQIYLLDNPLLREPLKADHVKPRLLGHWGTSPGQNLLYVHLNRLIKRHDAEIIYLSGPGHGGPAIVARAHPARPHTESNRAVPADPAATRRRTAPRC